MTDQELLHQIARSAQQKAGYKQLVRELGLGGGGQRRKLIDQLDDLTARGRLLKIDREHWQIPTAATASKPAHTLPNQTRDNLIAGRLDLHRDGFGFVRPNAASSARGSNNAASANQADIFIPPTEMNGAMQGDQVLVEVGPPKRDGRFEGRIARILERRNPTVVGIFHYARKGRRAAHQLGLHPGHWLPGEHRANLVTPSDSRMTQPILIPEGAEIPEGFKNLEDLPSAHRVLGAEATAAAHYDDLEGLVVDVEITSWPTPAKPAQGRVIEILGDPDDFGVDVEMIIRKHQLPRVFPDNVLAEARSVAHLDRAEVVRRVELDHDFRSLPIITIDGKTARDFDDAVLLRELPDTGPSFGQGPEAPAWELQVHIADVAEYVRPATDLDLEARLRGTSVYFPDRAIPMLPQELSSGICSLRPNEDRLVLSCLMRFTADARMVEFEILEGVIRSAARMTYDEVHAILEGDEAARAQYASLIPEIERMRRFAGLLNKRRSQRGSIDFDLPEPVIDFDAQGQMQGVSRAQRTWANRLIEEFMLAANECVATWLEDLAVPSIYRIHEKPDPRRVVDFEDAAAAFGYSLGLGALPVKKFQPRGDRREQQRSGRNARDARSVEIPEDIAVTPKMYQKLSARIAGKPEERILSYLMLRSLKQARYSEVNEGHFALAAPSYTHFTSPIRRYPDLIVHRIAKHLLQSGVSGQGTIDEGRHHSPWSNPNEAAIHFKIPGLRPPEKYAANQASGVETAPIPEAELAAIASETSLTERRAADAERELVEWKKVRFMQDRVGEEFDAMVLNPAKYGLFVELKDLFVEGLVPIETLLDDRYTYRENTREIIGSQTGRIYRAGDQVRVILDRVLALERKLQFNIIPDAPLRTRKGGTPSGRPPAKSTPKKSNRAKPAKEKNRPNAKSKYAKKGRPRK